MPNHFLFFALLRRRACFARACQLSAALSALRVPVSFAHTCQLYARFGQCLLYPTRQCHAKYFEYICIETPIITIHHHSLLKIRHRRFAERLRDKCSVKSSATAENTRVTREQHFNLSFSTFCIFLM
jgi:hypothetical protein